MIILLAVFVFLSMVVAGKAISLSYENEELSKMFSLASDLHFSSTGETRHCRSVSRRYHKLWLKKKREAKYRKRALDNVKNRVYYNPMSNELVVLSDLKFVGYITKGEINE